MHTTMVPEQVKTQKIQAGVQVSRQEDTNVIFSIGSTMEDFILFAILLVRNIDDPELDVEEDPEEEQDMDVEEDIPPAVVPHVGSPPPLSESSSDFDSVALVTTDRTIWVPPSSSTFEIRGSSSISLPHHTSWCMSGMETCRTKIAITRTRVDRVQRCMDAFDIDIDFVEQATTRVEGDRLRARVESAEVTATLAAMDRDRIERELYWIRGWLSRLQSEITRRGVVEAHPTESIDVLAVYGDAWPSELQGPPDGSQ
ncbi:hypothetical protein Tco_0719587 [Tanacetum coccineum]